MRGLKRRTTDARQKPLSRTLTGAWIETLQLRLLRYCKASRTLTGAWIETIDDFGQESLQVSRTLTGAWIETWLHLNSRLLGNCRTLTGAWIETTRAVRMCYNLEVAPSRVRGLKLKWQLCSVSRLGRRTLTGAWIETENLQFVFRGTASHPHGCVD